MKPIELTSADRALIANLATADVAQYAYVAGLRAGLRRAASECDQIACNEMDEKAEGARLCAATVRVLIGESVG
jgi:hypothetical protein